MQRHPVLQDLSRDHFVILNVVLRVRRGEEDAIEDLPSWLLDHFDEEERILGHHLPDALRIRWLADHARLRELIVEGGAPETLAEALATHIRWEEHAVFAWLQQHLDEKALDAIGVASLTHREATRPDGIGPNRVR